LFFQVFSQTQRASGAPSGEVVLMRRISLWLIASIFLISGLTTGCRDENDPEDWLDLMYDRPWREQSLKRLNEIFNKSMQENGSDLQNPKVKELVDLMVPELVKGYKEFTEDKFNRLEIIKLLAQMNDERSVEIFESGIELDEATDSMMFQVSANALRRQAVESALPKLIDGHKLIVQARDRRPGAPFTNAENEIEQAFISAAGSIVVKHPTTAHKAKVVEALCQIAETPDTLQELRLNMKALKELGRIGDPAAIPTLIKGIAMKGKRQPIGLGTIATAALQQIKDRDAVVNAVIQLAKGENKDFNEYYAEERKTDPLMKNPNWYMQEGMTFLGRLRYPSKTVIDFLMAQLNHNEPDDIDKAAAGIEGLPVNFDPEGWTVMRRNWAAVALAEIAHKPLLDAIKERMVFKKDGGTKTLQLQAEEAVGYVRAMGMLQYPKESCDLLLEVARAGDDSMRDKTFYNASLMCGKEFLGDMDKALKKIDCEKIVEERFPDGASEDEMKAADNECQVMKKRIEGYIARIKFAEECKDIECLKKTAASHSDPNVERAIYALYRIGRDDPAKKDEVVGILSANLNNPSKVALAASIFALDTLLPEGSEKLGERIQEVYREFASQSTYKDRARDLESFIGRVRNRGK